MAGSYSHVAHGWNLVENMGDAYEAAHELMWLVRRTMSDAKARRLLAEEYYPMQRGERPPDHALKAVRQMFGEEDTHAQ